VKCECHGGIIRAKRRAVVVFIGTLLLSNVLTPAQSRPEFAGTWRWISRSVPHPLTILQTPGELIIETMGLAQGNPADETFAVDGSLKTTIYDAGDFWRKQETTARWEGSTFIGTVVAKARWKREGPGETISLAVPHTIATRTLRLSADGNTLTISTSWHSPDAGRGPQEAIDRFIRTASQP
jgi:hypothetical protein